jgi:hypothetical protein
MVRVAELFDAIIDDVNSGLYDETGYKDLVGLEGVMRHMKHGKVMLADAKRDKQVAIQAQAFTMAHDIAGRANRGSLAGILAQGHDAGQLSLKAVATLTGKSVSDVKKNKMKVKEGNLGSFGSLSKKSYERKTIAEVDKVYPVHATTGLYPSRGTHLTPSDFTVDERGGRLWKP